LFSDIGDAEAGAEGSSKQWRDDRTAQMQLGYLCHFLRIPNYFDYEVNRLLDLNSLDSLDLSLRASHSERARERERGRVKTRER
jgi:hypothetical protein